jgi:hypothetical protein
MLIVNHAIEGAAFYMFDEGDPDPKLMYNISLSLQKFEELQIRKFYTDKRSA